MTHDFLVMISQSFGLFWLLAMAIGVIIYTFWPGNRERFDKAAATVLREEDRP